MRYENHSAVFNRLVGKPVWALNYEINDKKGTVRYKQFPVLGEIVHEGYYYWVFNPYRKNSESLCKSNIVDAYSRRFTDTYEEAVEWYNELVAERIEILNAKIESAKSDFIS